MVMETTRLSSKGQVIVPKSVRESHGWKAGQEFEIEDLGGSIVLRPVNAFPRSDVEDLIGCTGYKGPKHTLEDMEAAIAIGVAEQFAQGVQQCEQSP
jgi:AbrB family looped-hinge helix DNA binding protein